MAGEVSNERHLTKGFGNVCMGQGSPVNVIPSQVPRIVADISAIKEIEEAQVVAAPSGSKPISISTANALTGFLC